MTDNPTAPVVSSGEPQYAKLTQITVTSDDQMTAINQLLADGWRLVDIGFRPDTTVYVLGWHDEKRKPRAGFLAQNQ